MLPDLLKCICFRIGTRFVQLDAALPGPGESMTILFIFLIPIAVIAALIIVIVRRRKRKLAEEAAAAALKAARTAEEAQLTEDRR